MWKRAQNPLHLACKHNSNLEVIKFLVEVCKCDHKRDKDGNTPLALAAGYNNNFKIIKYLIE